MMSTPVDSKESDELKCTCGLPAKLRVSQTPKNPFRLFYNCSKGIHDQCEYFHWADEPAATGDRQTDELNLIRNVCIQLQRRMGKIEEEHEDEKTIWNEEKSALMSKLSTVQAELDGMKKRVKMANESDLIPPVNKFSKSDDEADDAIIIHSIGNHTMYRIDVESF